MARPPGQGWWHRGQHRPALPVQAHPTDVPPGPGMSSRTRCLRIGRTLGLVLAITGGLGQSRTALGTRMSGCMAASGSCCGYVMLQPHSPKNWATSMGRQWGRQKPAQGLWWPAGWVGGGVTCTQTPTCGADTQSWHHRNGDGAGTNLQRHGGAAGRSFSCPPAAAASPAARLRALQCSSHRSAAVCESHQYFMELLPPGEGLLSAPAFCCSYQLSSSHREHLISSQQPPHSLPFLH